MKTRGRVDLFTKPLWERAWPSSEVSILCV